MNDASDGAANAAADHPTDRAPRPVPTPGPSGAGAGTGDPGVDGALAGLAVLDGMPVRAHVAVFDAVHAALQDRLTQAQGGGT